MEWGVGVSQGGQWAGRGNPLHSQSHLWPLAASPLTFHTCPVVTPLGETSSSACSPEAVPLVGISSQWRGVGRKEPEG